MANKEHLNMLQQGSNVWNTWRKHSLEETIDLSSADLRNYDLRNYHLSSANLSNANLRGADLIYAELNNADLNNAKLHNSIFGDANLSNANLSGAELNSAMLSDANVFYANLSGANLSNANLSGANLSTTNLSGANLSGTNLIHTNLSSANLSNTNLSGAKTFTTIFHDIDLRLAKGLETIQHVGPSAISTSTLERSEGDIPEVFLRSAGLNDTFITYARSLVQKSIQYYTCFISYSSQDQEFVERLYADLQQKGVRCWFAPEDLKGGDFFADRIEEAIRVHDKLLLILSSHSVTSSWVEDEVRAALEKEERFRREQQQTKTILFPITIDTAMEYAPAQWAATMRRKRHIINFLNWKAHDEYQKGFQRLLRDLQPDKQ